MSKPNLSELKAKYEDLGREIERLENKKNSVFTPKIGQQYFYICNDGSVIDSKTYTSLDLNERNWLYGNCYKTASDAEDARQRQLATQRVIRKIAEINDGDDVRFGTSHSYDKWHIGYNHNADAFRFFSVIYTQDHSISHYLASKEKARQLIEECDRDDLLMFLGVK